LKKAQRGLSMPCCTSYFEGIFRLALRSAAFKLLAPIKCDSASTGIGPLQVSNRPVIPHDHVARSGVEHGCAYADIVDIVAALALAKKVATSAAPRKDTP
jgi:hypothetical protein